MRNTSRGSPLPELCHPCLILSFSYAIPRKASFVETARGGRATDNTRPAFEARRPAPHTSIRLSKGQAGTLGEAHSWLSVPTPSGLPHRLQKMESAEDGKRWNRRGQLCCPKYFEKYFIGEMRLLGVCEAEASFGLGARLPGATLLAMCCEQGWDKQYVKSATGGGRLWERE